MPESPLDAAAAYFDSQYVTQFYGHEVAAHLRALAANDQATCTTDTPCGPTPDTCDAEAGDPCANHEREQAHGEGEHAFCGPECTEATTQEPPR
ncbi:hypothetical protein [Streptomyces sp. W4I9-2]|uniref:hypothetical protein n=1 Tax=Streptomyces sp. W4I9-2 TaxID=3042297 RepID=UPI0027899238|nr:hypothetical protein [Streptomyces sp. W4I9-2]MDQ0694228.1 hypothetical protein [Streptomyces sp. W4I9-2]